MKEMATKINASESRETEEYGLGAKITTEDLKAAKRYCALPKG